MQLQPFSVDVDCPQCGAGLVRLTPHDTEQSEDGTVHVLRGKCPGQNCDATVETRFREPDPDDLRAVQHGVNALVAPARVERDQDDPPIWRFCPPTWQDGEARTMIAWSVD